MEFEYSIGELKTNIPWFPPDKERLQKWYEHFSKLPGFEKYNYLAGDSLLNTETWDVDIMVTGEVDDYLELKNLLMEGIRLGFENLQLVDIFYCSNVFTYEEGFQPYYKLRPWKGYTKIRDGEVEIDKEFRYTEEVIDGLFKVQHDDPPNSYHYWKMMYDRGVYPNERRNLKDVLEVE